ncbi:hypothetical protein PR048_026858 [Dryococelus australis]|uniref:Uncharacterized protein n=1 Tax=Dryococelus australis TaxID=614101 RepID=A0ABQ9GMG9_9NEOP|nr:hypothetical protein PR048_026858 [Dryococelus australis]
MGHLMGVAPRDTLLTSSEVVTVLRVPRDGNSLFAALAHQLKLNPIGSAEHIEDTETLRTAVWLELVRNFSDYTELVHRSVQLYQGHYLDFPSTEEKVDAYLRDLDTPGFPGGAEVIQATANLAGVDVVLYQERGDAYLVESSADEADRAIAIVQRVLLGVDGRPHIFYDSVIGVQQI